MAKGIHEHLVAPPHPSSLADEDLLRDCTFGRSRSGGPGGQHRNKVETQVTLVHTPTGIEAHAGERRSVSENRPVAIRRLRLLLASHARAPVASGEARSELWISRVRAGRIVLSDQHRDLATMIALALDVIDSCGLDHKRAATRLECSASQLVKLLGKHPPVLAALNVSRTARGMNALRA